MIPVRLYDIGGKDIVRSPHESSSSCEITFDPEQSHLVAFGINHQSHERFKHRTLGQSVVDDAHLISKRFVDVGIVPASNVKVHKAKVCPDDCAFNGMKRLFINTAKMVGREGLFVFHFSGHGIRMETNKWGLAPSDFDYTSSTYITADVLHSWLEEAECRSKNVLFTLDCCYAGGIADTLTVSGDGADCNRHRNIYVLSACTAYETSYAVETLGHSVFSFFLAHAMKTQTSRQSPGLLPLQKIFDECYVCSVALSTLMFKYSAEDNNLNPARIHPELKIIGFDEPDGGRFENVCKYYDTGSKWLPLNEVTELWLAGVRTNEGPVWLLQSKGLFLHDKVLLTAVCSMMYSIASFQLALDPPTVSKINLFITGYMKVLSVIDYHTVGSDFSLNHFACGLGYYIEALKNKNGVDHSKLEGLYRKVLQEAGASDEGTDSAQCEDTGPIGRVKFEPWVPLEDL